MEPVDFPQAHRTYTKPHNMTDAECGALRVYDTGAELVSCWQLTWRERWQVLLRGRVWLWVVGRSQPPVAIETVTPFAFRCEEGGT